MMASTIKDMLKTSVERKTRGDGYRFTIGVGTANQGVFDLSESEFHELYKQMTQAYGATPIGLVAIPEPSSKAQTNASPSDKLYMGTLGPFDVNTLSFIPSPGAERIPFSTSAPQPPPTGNGQVVLWQAIAKAVESLDLAEADWLCELLHERAIAGKAKYGTWLRANNGRDVSIDYLQEALDALMYSTQEWLETSSDSARAKQEAALAAIQLCYESEK